MANTLINEKNIKLTQKVSVEWVDSVAASGWRHESTLTDDYMKPYPIISFGFLIKDHKDYIVVSTSISSNGNAMDPLTIAKCAITKMKLLKDPKCLTKLPNCTKPRC